LRIAEEDIIDILSRAAEDSPSDAKNILTQFLAELQAKAENPRLASVPQEPGLAQAGYRYLVVENFLIFYTVEEANIVVHRVLSGASEYKGIFRRT
jgi:plasmid stabilization system protein ParE